MIKPYQVQHSFLKQIKDKNSMPDELILALNAANQSILKKGSFVVDVGQDTHISFDNMVDVENYIVKKMLAFVREKTKQNNIMTSAVIQ